MKDIATVRKILKLREVLQGINQSTYSYVTLNKNFPLDRIDDRDGLILLSSYQEIISTIKSLITKYEHEYEYPQKNGVETTSTNESK